MLNALAYTWDCDGDVVVFWTSQVWITITNNYYYSWSLILYKFTHIASMVVLINIHDCMLVATTVEGSQVYY